MTHTPGKWIIKRHGTAMSIRGNGYTVATIIRTSKASPEEKAANARLIAAAPELLEALKGLMKEAVKLAESQPDNAPIWAWIDDASDAITKAER